MECRLCERGRKFAAATTTTRTTPSPTHSLHGSACRWAAASVGADASPPPPPPQPPPPHTPKGLVCALSWSCTRLQACTCGHSHACHARSMPTPLHTLFPCLRHRKWDAASVSTDACSRHCSALHAQFAITSAATTTPSPTHSLRGSACVFCPERPAPLGYRFCER